MTKILFITSTRIGDAVLSTGLIDHLARTQQNPAFTIVCGPLPKSLFEGVPGLENLIVLKKKPRNGHWIELWKQVVTTKWDIVVDLRNSFVSRAIRAKRKYIFGARYNKGHKVAQNAAVMGLRDIPPPVLFPTSEQKDWAKAIIPDGGPVLAVGPTANWIGKTWPAENFIELIVRITAEDGILPHARVAIFAAPGEEDEAYRVLKSIPEARQINFIAKGNPGQAAAAIARCDLYIGNDSGLMHCAAAAGVPTVGLFGASYVDIYGPYGNHATYAHTPESFDQLTFFDGYDPKTLRHSLMTSLTVDQVFAVIKDFGQRTAR